MINFVLGFISGALVLFVASFFFKWKREKRGKYEREYLSRLFTTKIKDTLRHIVFEYSIKRSNQDFLLNVNFRGGPCIQIMHRSHFPELCESEDDTEFGMAVYIPVEALDRTQIYKLESILKEESEKFDAPKYPVPYYVLDLGRRIRYGGYLLSRISKELYDPRDEDVELELFSEGPIPYHKAKIRKKVEEIEGLFQYTLEVLKKESLRHEYQRFPSGAIMLDIWKNEDFFVLQFENDSIGVSKITDSDGFDTIPDERFYDERKYKEKLDWIISGNSTI